MSNWLTDLFGGKKKTETAAPPPPSSRELLEALTGEVKNLQLSVRRVDLDDPEAVKRLKDMKAQEAAAEEATKMESLHRDMRHDMLAACAELKAGVDEAELDRLSKSIEAFKVELMPALQEKGVRGDMFRSLISRFLVESGKMAWHRLEQLLKDAGQSWPDPEGLTPGMTEAEKQAARDRLQEDIKHDFIHGKARLELLHGAVPIWRSAYPERTSALWRRTVLRGVGTILKARLLDQILTDLKGRQEEVKVMVVEIVSAPLKDIREAMTRGVDLAEATHLLEDAQAGCCHKATEQIWALVGPVARV
jgi:hypothetical protein